MGIISVPLFGTLCADCIKAGDRANRVTANRGLTVFIMQKPWAFSL